MKGKAFQERHSQGEEETLAPQPSGHDRARSAPGPWTGGVLGGKERGAQGCHSPSLPAGPAVGQRVISTFQRKTGRGRLGPL